MKRIDTCNSNTVLVAVLLAGVVMVMGAYRIFSYLCEVSSMLTPVNMALAVLSATLAVTGFLIARRSFKRLQYLRDYGGEEQKHDDEQ